MAGMKCLPLPADYIQCLGLKGAVYLVKNICLKKIGVFRKRMYAMIFFSLTLDN